MAPAPTTRGAVAVAAVGAATPGRPAAAGGAAIPAPAATRAPARRAAPHVAPLADAIAAAAHLRAARPGVGTLARRLAPRLRLVRLPLATLDRHHRCTVRHPGHQSIRPGALRRRRSAPLARLLEQQHPQAAAVVVAVLRLLVALLPLMEELRPQAALPCLRLREYYYRRHLRHSFPFVPPAGIGNSLVGQMRLPHGFHRRYWKQQYF